MYDVFLLAMQIIFASYNIAYTKTVRLKVIAKYMYIFVVHVYIFCFQIFC